MDRALAQTPSMWRKRKLIHEPTTNKKERRQLMGKKATEEIKLTLEELENYLRANHAIYVEVNGDTYYLTDANDIYWRAQDTNELNEKGHYADCSELVSTLSEFMDLPIIEGKSLNAIYPNITFYPSIRPEDEEA